MKILLTGGSGQLGKELKKLRNYQAPSSRVFNIVDRDSVETGLAHYQPDLIVHAAAYTNTFAPDNDPMEAFDCFVTNVLGTRNLVELAKCPIIYISTESAYHPYNFYVLTKVQGEHEVSLHKYGYKIIRTSFRCDPFEYPKACTDMYTVADTAKNIAKLIDKMIELPVDNKMICLGTGVKTVYELAKRTRPDVIPATRAEVSPRLPSMEELLHV